MQINTYQVLGMLWQDADKILRQISIFLLFRCSKPDVMQLRRYLYMVDLITDIILYITDIKFYKEHSWYMIEWYMIDDRLTQKALNAPIYH